MTSILSGRANESRGNRRNCGANRLQPRPEATSEPSAPPPAPGKSMRVNEEPLGEASIPGVPGLGGPEACDGRRGVAMDQWDLTF